MVFMSKMVIFVTALPLLTAMRGKFRVFVTLGGRTNGDYVKNGDFCECVRGICNVFYVKNNDFS